MYCIQAPFSEHCEVGYFTDLLRAMLELQLDRIKHLRVHKDLRVQTLLDVFCKGKILLPLLSPCPSIVVIQIMPKI